MKNLFLVYFLVIFSFLSCKNQQDKLSELNLLYQDNYEFSNKILNRNRSFYYFIIEERPIQKIEALNQLDLSYQLLISDLDKAISNPQSNLKNITSEYNRIANEIPKIVNDRKNYLISGFEPIKPSSDELNLNAMKLRLTMAMAYAFEYAGLASYQTDSTFFGIKSYSSKTKCNGIKLSLTSNNDLKQAYNRNITIKKIELNGKEIELKYTYKDNYSFADIEFDSLQKGEYKINGIFKFSKEGYELQIPINEKFKVE
ncbi:hypothetical protein [Winogradskyella forsetii]|uniref:hypothetical protein n=1 Tax=Winogradskyella forsetii TaxID=2686077 RepID=UPI0015BFA040|nr:hypothetical protein [Winogradskyella forsetii]